ncbi:hypothetical protein RRG08_009611 [Elysia crispata]|uniref:Uncharacterized protein n=1 Tax=Elysia crispata TaxID=231223 RepID=A0AAE0XTF7_9GAST|nr:hypothetical protein RRG08_009611 [Elysia crispata]
MSRTQLLLSSTDSSVFSTQAASSDGRMDSTARQRATVENIWERSATVIATVTTTPRSVLLSGDLTRNVGTIRDRHSYCYYNTSLRSAVR